MDKSTRMIQGGIGAAEHSAGFAAVAASGFGSASPAILLAIALGCATTEKAAAFPLLDPDTAALSQGAAPQATSSEATPSPGAPSQGAVPQGAVPQGEELGAQETGDLRRQLQLVNGISAPPGGGWTFIPQVDLQEELTDNVYQVHSPRRWDFVTFLSPGFSLAGDVPRANVLLTYSPTLALYGRTGNLNALTQQLNGLGNITVVPDLAFVDLRAVAGVSNLYGGFGGMGGVGAQAGTYAFSQAQAANQSGLNRQNETQNVSLSIAPYLQRQFGDYGTGRIGYSGGVSRSSPVSGFAASPFPFGGSNGQTLYSNEGVARFVTGDIFQRLQDTIDIDLQQNNTTTESGFVNGVTGLTSPITTHTRSSRIIFNDQISYQLNRSVNVFVSGGHENIHYSGVGAQQIDDMTWSLGTRLTPNPDSALTVSYGHHDGFNAFEADGYYAVTARTALTVSYAATLGTQLEYLQSQLNSAAATRTGQLVNGTNGGPLFVNTNSLAQQNGVFRTNTLTFGSTTSWDRDIVSLTMSLAKQTATGVANPGAANDVKTFGVTWVHQMRPDMTVSAAGAYSIQSQGMNVGSGGYDTYIATAAWQYQISGTVQLSLRYSFFDRIAPVSSFNVYQSLLFAGLSKRF